MLYECETWSVILGVEQKWRVRQKTLLNRICAPKKEEGR
jgi:hypothetical protein